MEKTPWTEIKEVLLRLESDPNLNLKNQLFY